MSGETQTADVVSHEQDGRVLSGAGPDVTVDDLKKVMARHAPPPPEGQAPQADPPADSSAPAAAPVAEPPAAPADAKPTRGQKRIAQITAERKAEARQRTAAETENAVLKAQLEALERAQQPPQTQAQAPQPQQPPQPPPGPPPLQQLQQLAQLLPPVLQDFTPFLTAYPTATYNDFELARLQFITQAQAQQFDARFRQSIEADRASRSFQERTEETRQKARGVYPDFDAVIQNGPGAGVTFDMPRLEKIISSPHSGHLQYVIAKDAALAHRLATCSPYDFAAELAAITPTSAVARPAPTEPSDPLTPPAPYQPVGTGSQTTTLSSAEVIKGSFDFDKSGYREKRDAELRRVRRR